MTRHPSQALLAPLVALLLVAGACNNDDGGGTSGGTTTTGARSTTTTSSPGGSGSTTTTAVDASGVTTTAVPAGGEGQGVIEVAIVGGKPQGGVRREKVKQGSQVTLRVSSDVADELHVHSYDLKLDLKPGQSADLTFLAKIAGVFEVELEGRGTKVLELEVGP